MRRGLISETYEQLNARMHEEMAGYGASGWQYIGPILKCMEKTGSSTLLDYGCGKGALLDWLPSSVPCWGYDPAIPRFRAEPEPADMVVCLDVMEHVEPTCIPAVLEHIRSKIIRAGFLVIALDEAQKFLPDGRNAHLSVMPAEWWLDNLKGYRLVREIPLSKRALTVCVEK